MSQRSRREVLRAGGMLGALAPFWGMMTGEVVGGQVVGGQVVGKEPADGGAGGVAASQPAAAGWAHFPNDDPQVVREVVGKSHVDEAAVRALVGAHRHLVNAAWDWGFGDWETALGAAAHTGRRGIAEFLLEHGARMDVFAAAMLGYTPVVKAMVEARPGVQRVLGPHGIPLLAHARAGGEEARETFEYLESLGDAGVGAEVVEISAEDQKRFLGVYGFGAGERFEIKLSQRGWLVMSLAGRGDIRIHWLGGEEFYPSGVPTTRLLFDRTGVTITAGPKVLRGERRG